MIEGGALLVVGLDPVQIELDQLVGGQPAGFVGVLNILYARFRKVKGCRLALAFTGEKGDEKEQGDGSGSVPRNVLLVHMLTFSGLRLDPASPGETWRSPGMIAKPEPHTA